MVNLFLLKKATWTTTGLWCIVKIWDENWWYLSFYQEAIFTFKIYSMLRDFSEITNQQNEIDLFPTMSY